MKERALAVAKIQHYRSPDTLIDFLKALGL